MSEPSSHMSECQSVWHRRVITHLSNPLHYYLASTHRNGRSIANVLPKVTRDLPVYPVLSGNHISDLPLADPSYGQPGLIDILLGVDVFVDVLLQGWRTGPPGSPIAFETMGSE